MINSILCYGDSNTWGFDPRSGSRFAGDTRWPGVLQKCLGSRFRVIEEGLNGRTVHDYYPEGNLLNGAENLPACITAYSPLSVVIVFLGINDLFCERDLPVESLPERLGRAIDSAAESHFGSVLLVAPLPINQSAANAALYEHETAKSKLLAAEYRRVAERLGWLFLNPSEVITASAVDGVHIDAQDHIKLGHRIFDLLESSPWF